jgi:[protein-PII] uridylyltransferase
MDQVINGTSSAGVRAVINRRALAATLSAIADGGDVHSTASRDGIRDALKAALGDGREEIQRLFEDGARAIDCAKSTARVTDQILRSLYDFMITHVHPNANTSRGERLALVAVGGYGRSEMAPHSDVDLLFLQPYKETPWSKQALEYLLYMLWDLGLKVGYATRSISECIQLAKADITIRTTIIEARYLCGDRELFEKLMQKFQSGVVKGSGPAFVEAKLAERDERHLRMGDSRYVVEPNVKNGKGGLRDLHTLFWIGKYLYHVTQAADLVDAKVFSAKQFARFSKAENYLWAVRFNLHYMAGRAEERLTLNVQSELGRRMGYKDHTGNLAVERFMKHYFLYAKEVGNLTRVFCAVLEEQHKRRPRFRMQRVTLKPEHIDGFVVVGGRVDVESETLFKIQPIKMLRLFHLAQERRVDIHPRAQLRVTQSLHAIDGAMRADPEAGRLFMEMLTAPKDVEITLRRLNESGVFGRFIPDFGRVVAQMQHDMYHVYTVDEHTIRAVGMLARIEAGEFAKDMPLSHNIIHKVLSRKVLYLAVLLHDIAKGRGGDHSKLGAGVAAKVAPLLGLGDAESETVEWLVRAHLDMSRVAFRRDLADPKTIANFAAIVQSPERLQLLLLLTVADIRAVGPGRWNNWSGQLLRELYFATLEVLSGGEASIAGPGRIEAAKAALGVHASDWGEGELDAHTERFRGSYWTAVSATSHAHHADFLRNVGSGKDVVAVDAIPDAFRAVTDFTVYAPDQPGLFAKIAGAMAVAGVNIVDARVSTTTDSMALDQVSVQGADGKAVDAQYAVDKIKKIITDVLAGQVEPAEVLRHQREGADRTSVFSVAPRVLVNNEVSDIHTMIEVNGRDRRGLLFWVTLGLTELGLEISSARIATYGERAVDVFYVRDSDGLKITEEVHLDAIRKRLMDAVVRSADTKILPANPQSDAAIAS